MILCVYFVGQNYDFVGSSVNVLWLISVWWELRAISSGVIAVNPAGGTKGTRLPGRYTLSIVLLVGDAAVSIGVIGCGAATKLKHI